MQLRNTGHTGFMVEFGNDSGHDRLKDRKNAMSRGAYLLGRVLIKGGFRV